MSKAGDFSGNLVPRGLSYPHYAHRAGGGGENPGNEVAFPGVEFLRILFKFKKRKENSSSYVHVLHKMSN